MSQRFCRGFAAAEKTELWDRWKRGESLKAIGRAFGKQSLIYFWWLRMVGVISILRCVRGRASHGLIWRRKIACEKHAGRSQVHRLRCSTTPHPNTARYEARKDRPRVRVPMWQAHLGR